MTKADIAKRAAAFISERDPFGDHFSAHDLAQLDPEGGYVEVEAPMKSCTCHPDEAPVPCAHHYALSECLAANVEENTP